MDEQNEAILQNDHFSIVDLLKIDNDSITEKASALSLLKNHSNTQRFLVTLNKSLDAREKTVYDSLNDIKNLESKLLETACRSVMLRKITEDLVIKTAKSANVNKKLEASINALIGLTNYHLQTEARELLPQIKLHLHPAILNEIGFQFTIIRKFSAEELKASPVLQKEIFPATQIYPDKRGIHSLPNEFVRKVNFYISGLISESKYI